MEVGKTSELNPNTAERYLKGLIDVMGKSLEFPLTGEGLIKKHFGRCRYGHVKLIINEELGYLDRYSQLQSSFCFEIGEEKIPREFQRNIHDALQSFMLVYRFFYKNQLNFRIVDGSFHPVDSDPYSFEVATYLALEGAFK